MRFDFIFIILFIYSSTVDAADTVKCLKFNSTACKTLGSDSDECSGSVECTSCYFLFLNENNVIEPYLRGCWNTYCENSTCDSTITNANYRFCCCNTDNCNSNATVSADPFVSSTKGKNCQHTVSTRTQSVTQPSTLSFSQLQLLILLRKVWAILYILVSLYS